MAPNRTPERRKVPHQAPHRNKGQKAVKFEQPTTAIEQKKLEEMQEEPELDLSDPMVLGCMKFKAEWVINADAHNNIHYAWLFLVTLVVIYNIVLIPLRSAFRELDDNSMVTAFMAFDYIGDIILFIDLFVHLMSGFLSEDGVVVVEPRKLIHHWWHKNGGKYDVIGILPTDLFFLWTGMQAPYDVWRINRFFKYGRFLEFVQHSEVKVANADILRLASIMFQFLLLIHINACLYYFVSEQLGLNTTDWAYPGLADWRKHGEGETNVNDTLFQKYTWSHYWSFHTLTMIGIIVQPQSEYELLFMTFNYIVSVMLFSQILGHVSRTVLNSTAAARKFRTKMDAVTTVLDRINITGSIRDRIRAYFEYLWINKRLVGDREALEGLSERLETEIAIKVHMETLKRVRIFQGVEPGLLADLVLKLEPQIYPPGDYVCRKGDVGKELYIVKTGCLEVVSDDGDIVFARLGEGSVFGEISILNIAGIKSGNRRTANVRSVGYSDLFRLTKHDLWEALIEYPEGKKKMLELGKQILMKDNLLNVAEAERAEKSHENFLENVDNVENRIDKLQTKLGRLLVERQAAVAKIQKRIQVMQHVFDIEDMNDAEWKKAEEPIKEPETPNDKPSSAVSDNKSG